MSEHILECHSLYLGYDGYCVVEDVNLQIPKGILLPFVGVNGAGKTTLFNTLLGLLKPLRGTIKRHFGKIPPGYVPQQKNIDPLYPVSLRQIVAMGLYPETSLLGRLSQEQQQHLEQTLEHFQLQQQQHKTFAELSGGMKQKALIARAFVGRSEVIFLDEPTAGLDAGAEKDLLAMLLELNQKQQKTILMAHHRLEDLSKLSDKVCRVQDQHAQIVPA